VGADWEQHGVPNSPELRDLFCAGKEWSSASLGISTGVERTQTARLAGSTPIWRCDVASYRLEGDLTLDEAVRIALSADQRGQAAGCDWSAGR
jgi:hypothetical protein